MTQRLPPRYVCTRCGWHGESTRTITKGHIVIELILWLMFLLPGLFYSAWRHASRYEGCPQCRAANPIPANSPLGRKLLEDIKSSNA